MIKSHEERSFLFPDLEEENRKKLEKNENMKVALSMSLEEYLPFADCGRILKISQFFTKIPSEESSGS